jgi:hypothetical protein
VPVAGVFIVGHDVLQRGVNKKINFNPKRQIDKFIEACPLASIDPLGSKLI